jgi:hypothetical protein
VVLAQDADDFQHHLPGSLYGLFVIIDAWAYHVGLITSSSAAWAASSPLAAAPEAQEVQVYLHGRGEVDAVDLASAGYRPGIPVESSQFIAGDEQLVVQDFGAGLHDSSCSSASQYS